MYDLFQDCGETALHLAVTREMGNSLQIVDFLVQNMSSAQLDKQTSVHPDGYVKITF